jgi:gentisate 1,2-dioxygenase
MTYLGVSPTEPKFNLTVFRKERMLAEIETIRHQPGAEQRNRMGILLGNRSTESTTKTLTHILWSLLNVLPPNEAQRPHRHNSVALDLCVFSPSSSDTINSPGNGVYTLMGPELGEDGCGKSY